MSAKYFPLSPVNQAELDRLLPRIEWLVQGHYGEKALRAVTCALDYAKLSKPDSKTHTNRLRAAGRTAFAAVLIAELSVDAKDDYARFAKLTGAIRKGCGDDFDFDALNQRAVVELVKALL